MRLRRLGSKSNLDSVAFRLQPARLRREKRLARFTPCARQSGAELPPGALESCLVAHFIPKPGPTFGNAL